MRCYTEIDGVQVDSKIFTSMFCCDYLVCKGACCHQPMPDEDLTGGELLDSEASDILFYRKDLAQLCERGDALVVEQTPVAKYGGTFYTNLRKDKCVFCNMEAGTCVLKIAKERGMDALDIPISCQLYPILWEETTTHTRLSIGDTFDSYCKTAYEKGKREKVFLLDFLRIPLIRAFGEDFYDKLKAVQQEFI